MPDNNDAPQVLTVKELRDALAQLPDDVPFAVAVPLEDDLEVTFALTGAPKFSMVDWGDGRGLIPDQRYIQAEAYAYLTPRRDRLVISDADAPEGM